MLDNAADRYGSRVALIARQPSGQKTSMTYRELRDSSHRAALLLLSRGVKPGDRVLLIGENSPDWVLAYFAILCAGAIAVPLDHLISADELAPICAIAEPTAALRSSAVAQAPRKTESPRRCRDHRDRFRGAFTALHSARKRSRRRPSLIARRSRRSFSPREPPARPRA